MSRRQDPLGTKRIVAIIPEEIHMDVKVMCAMRNVTMNHYFLEAIAAKLTLDQSRQ